MALGTKADSCCLCFFCSEYTEDGQVKKETKYSYSELGPFKPLYMPRTHDHHPSPVWQWWAVQWGYGQVWKAIAQQSFWVPVLTVLPAHHPGRSEHPL